MAWTHVKRTHSPAGPQDVSRHLAFYEKGNFGSPLLWKGVMGSHQAALGHSYGRAAGDDTEVARQAEEAGVGGSSPIHHEKVRRLGEAFRGPENHGEFPEREESRDVRETNRFFRPENREEFPARPFHQGDAGNRHVPEGPLPDRHVYTRHRRGEPASGIFEGDAPRKPDLQCRSLRGGKKPLCESIPLFGVVPLDFQPALLPETARRDSCYDRFNPIAKGGIFLNRTDFFRLAACILACQAAGIFGSFFTVSSLQSWYSGLVKPAFNPPGWVFGPVWTALYTLMGLAAWLVWRKGSLAEPNIRNALFLFLIQLSLNALWSVLFFGLRSPLLALLDILALAAAILGTIAAFRPISPPAAWLMVPYLAWVVFAAILNAAIWKLNP